MTITRSYKSPNLLINLSLQHPITQSIEEPSSPMPGPPRWSSATQFLRWWRCMLHLSIPTGNDMPSIYAVKTEADKGMKKGGGDAWELCFNENHLFIPTSHYWVSSLSIIIFFHLCNKIHWSWTFSWLRRLYLTMMCCVFFLFPRDLFLVFLFSTSIINLRIPINLHNELLMCSRLRSRIRGWDSVKCRSSSY